MAPMGIRECSFEDSTARQRQIQTKRVQVLVMNLVIFRNYAKAKRLILKG